MVRHFVDLKGVELSNYMEYMGHYNLRSIKNIISFNHYKIKAPMMSISVIYG